MRGLSEKKPNNRSGGGTTPFSRLYTSQLFHIDLPIPQKRASRIGEGEVMRAVTYLHGERERVVGYMQKECESSCIHSADTST